MTGRRRRMGGRRAWAGSIAALLLTVLAAAPAFAELAISADEERPLRGDTVRLTVTDDGAPAAGALVVAVYRPASNTVHREELPPVDASGTVLWTPAYTGPVSLQAWPAGSDLEADRQPAAVLTVAVRFGSFPLAGLIIMIIAGVLLFGGAMTAFWMLLQPTGHPPTEEPPST